MSSVRNTLNPLFTVHELTKPEYHDLRILCDEGGSSSTSMLLLAAASSFMRDLLLEASRDDEGGCCVSLVGFGQSVVDEFVSLLTFGDPSAKDDSDLRRLAQCLRLDLGCEPLEQVKVEILADERMDSEELLPKTPHSSFANQRKRKECVPVEEIPRDLKKRKKLENKCIRTSSKSKPFYFCLICQTVVSSKWLLMQHMKLHVGEQASECMLCRQFLESEEDLDFHENKHDGKIESFEYQVLKSDEKPKWIFCPFCQQSFLGGYKFALHYSTHKEIGSMALECADCKKHIKSLPDWRYHKQQHEGDSRMCTICGQVLKVYSFYQHMKKVHTDLNYSCTICSKRFKTKYALQAHEFLHENIRNFVCEDCGSRFKTKANLRDHLRSHCHAKGDPARLLPCEHCGRCFTHHSSLKEHKENIHGESTAVLECPKCDKKFNTLISLKKHAPVHYELRYLCLICKNKFKREFDAERHIVKHTELKPYCCTACQECFKVQARALRHIKAVHAGRKTKINFVRCNELVDMMKTSVRRLDDEELKKEEFNFENVPAFVSETMVDAKS